MLPKNCYYLKDSSDRKILELWVFENIKDFRKGAFSNFGISYEDDVRAATIDAHSCEDNPLYILVSEDYLTLEILNHEALHAAFAVYRKSKSSRIVNLGKYIGPSEEELCYLHGNIIGTILDTLKGDYQWSDFQFTPRKEK